MSARFLRPLQNVGKGGSTKQNYAIREKEDNLKITKLMENEIDISALLEKLKQPVTSSSITSYYDLRHPLVLIDFQKPKTDYVIEKKLKCGVNVKVRNDRYFVFDFKESKHGKSVCDNPQEIGDKTIPVLSERIEFLNAFLFCVISKESEMNNLSNQDYRGFNNYFVCARDAYELEKILEREDLNYASSHAYLLAVKSSSERIPKSDNNENHQKIIVDALELLDTFASRDDSRWVYSLGLFYRACICYRHGLNIDAASWGRVAYEFISKKDKNFCKNHNIDDTYILKLKDLRDSALHESEIPGSTSLNDLGRGLEHIKTLYEKCVNVKLCFPIVRRSATYIDPY